MGRLFQGLHNFLPQRVRPMGRLFQVLHNPAAVRANGSKSGEIRSVSAPGVSFHGTVDPAASEQWVFRSTGAVPGRCGPLWMQPLKKAPHGPPDVFSRFKSDPVPRRDSPVRRLLNNGYSGPEGRSPGAAVLYGCSP